jgi:hypothetical protein
MCVCVFACVCARTFLCVCVTPLSVTKPPPRPRRKVKADEGEGGEGAAAAALGAGTLEAACILDARRAQNVCIALARMKLGAAAVLQAVIAADMEVLTVDVTQALLRCVPLQEEIDKLVAFAGAAHPNLTTDFAH